MLRQETDSDEHMIGAEGYTTVPMLVDGRPVGFVTFRFEQDLPSLEHFIIRKEDRSMRNARALIKMFRVICRSMGYRHAIVHASREYLNTFIQYYFKKKPYGKVKDRNYYIVEV